MTETMPNWLKKQAELTPHREALIFEERTYTFSDVFEEAKAYTGKLGTLGLHSGSTAALLFSNQAESVFILYALQMAGIKAVILNNRLTAEELSWQLADCEAEVLVYEDGFDEKVTTITSKIKFLSTAKLKQLEDSEALILEEYDMNSVTTIMYTSGTTGNPKGVMQTYGNHWWSANASALNLGLHEQDKWLCTVPIFHISGYSILMRSQIYGMPIVLHSSFNEKKVIEDIQRYNITIMSVVSTMLRRILDDLGEERLPGAFRCMLLGGGPAPLPLLESCLEKEIPVFQTYGMTETSSQFATLSPEYSIERLGSAGKALFPNQIRIVDGDGQDVPSGAEGEIIVKGPNVTIGYLNRPDETADKIRERWLHTGDIGYIDDDGFLYVLDRRSDLIISGGENIYPAEIEGILLSHPGVADAGVIGAQDEQWGQVPVAFIVKSEPEVSEKDLLDLCERKLAKYKLPKQIHFVESLPRNAAKKLLRRKLREWLETKGDGVGH
ncbi:o-succinylbenzoate--CoA ligase [Mesobacillus selenatarsenatis]|uniref:2-succinylbenzoate--CoA ligase n=1 Tax=Mesobacillus selenatarsenatis TaxID=388741 RepID=A0A846TMK3_9BACI|nr:o-succinylbenzoate--CoA ligase [Mesobacillus selenatarsenatis]NKE08009.1 o-succinylbenzoate--CoA ligase [Mesobacillus selenatarsenatis]